MNFIIPILNFHTSLNLRFWNLIYISNRWHIDRIQKFPTHEGTYICKTYLFSSYPFFVQVSGDEYTGRLFLIPINNKTNEININFVQRDSRDNVKIIFEIKIFTTGIVNRRFSQFYQILTFDFSFSFFHKP